MKSKNPLTISTFSFIKCFIFLLICGFVFYNSIMANPGPDKNATPKICADCHEEQVVGFKTNPHIIIDTKMLATKVGAQFSCEACHGDAKKHIEEGEGKDIFSFKPSDMEIDKTRTCLKCHTTNHFDYLASPHGKSTMDCTSCHTIHMKFPKQNLLAKGSSKTCFSCHEDIFSQFKLNERHRLQEGILECVSCHNPHTPATRERLGGFKHEACYRCHTDKEGPFFFEHGSVRIEGCSACHEVHGSPNRHMLIQQNVAELCFSCHSAVPGWHSRFTPETNCVVCHSTIHGSNFSSKFIK